MIVSATLASSKQKRSKSNDKKAYTSGQVYNHSLSVITKLVTAFFKSKQLLSFSALQSTSAVQSTGVD